LTGLEREFIDASRSENEREALRQQRENRRLRTLLAGAAVLLVVAVGAGVVALLQRHSAKHQATVALARGLGAEAVSEPRIHRAMLLAREAVNLDHSRQTAGTLLATLLRSPAALATFSSPITDRPQSVTLSPDGKTLAVVENTDLVRFYDTRTRAERLQPLQNAVHIPPVYSSDGTRVLLMRTPSETAPPALDVRDGRTLRHLRFLQLDQRWLSTQTGFWNPLLLSADGATAYMPYTVVNPDTQRDGPAYIDRWDTRSGKLLGTAALGSNGMFDAVVTRSGNLLALTDTHIVTLD